MKSDNKKKIKVLVRGAGDIASGIIWNLAYASFDVCCTEVNNPSTIRTEVAFSSAVYDGKKVLDGIECILCKETNNSSIKDGLCHFDNEKDLQSVTSMIYKCFDEKKVALIVDPEVRILKEIKFDVVVDAILAKKNLGTKIDMAPLVIGVGPGFTTNVDCHIAIETMRGHNLARIIEDGSPMKNTGVPGFISGHSSDRVIYSPESGIIHNLHKIGDVVKKDEVIAEITLDSKCKNYMKDDRLSNKSLKEDSKGDISTNDDECIKVFASIDGLLRGIIRDGYNVTKGLKIADIDPRLSEYENCFTISDKARAIGTAVVTGIVNRFY